MQPCPENGTRSRRPGRRDCYVVAAVNRFTHAWKISLGGIAAEDWPSSSDANRISLFWINIQILDRFRHGFARDLFCLRQRIERGDDGALGIHFEEPAEPLARVAPAKSVRAESRQSTRDPRRNLLRHDLHKIRYGHEDALFLFQHRLDVRLSRRLGWMKHVPSLRAQRFGAELLVVGRAPDIGGDVVAFRQEFLSLQRRADDRSAAKD